MWVCMCVYVFFFDIDRAIQLANEKTPIIPGQMYVFVCVTLLFDQGICSCCLCSCGCDVDVDEIYKCTPYDTWRSSCIIFTRIIPRD